jgi:probable HAF family extracellular repeat protein
MYRAKLLAAIAVLLVVPCVAQYRYSTVDLPGAVRTKVFAINNHRQYVGASWDSVGNSHAIFFDGRELKPLNLEATLGSLTSSRAFSLNNRGRIVGQYTDSSGNTHGYVFHQDTATAVDYPGALWTAVYGINDLGTVIGIFYDTTWKEHAFVLRNHVFKNIDIAGGDTYPLSIDNRDEIVGEFIDVSGTTGHGYFQLRNGKSVLYDAPGAPANSTFFISINNLNRILGEYYPADTYQNFILVNGKVILFDLAGGITPTYVSAQTINDRGDVVGWFDDANGEHGFLALRESGSHRR